MHRAQESGVRAQSTWPLASIEEKPGPIVLPGRNLAPDALPSGPSLRSGVRAVLFLSLFFLGQFLAEPSRLVQVPIGCSAGLGHECRSLDVSRFSSLPIAFQSRRMRRCCEQLGTLQACADFLGQPLNRSGTHKG